LILQNFKEKFVIIRFLFLLFYLNKKERRGLIGGDPRFHLWVSKGFSIRLQAALQFFHAARQKLVSRVKNLKFLLLGR
jgi:hypothetical protein